MKKSLFLVAIILTLTVIACSFNVSTANISGATLSTAEDGSHETTTFAQDDVFYAIVEVANAPDDTTVKAEWIAVEADGVDPNFLIDDKELQGGGTVTFSLSNDQLWPAGAYKVDLYLNGELDRSLAFNVEGEAVAQEEPTDEPQPEEPTDTPEPDPTDTPQPEPTNTPESSTGDTLAGGDEDNETDDGALPEGVYLIEAFDSNSNDWETGEFDNDTNVSEVIIDDGKLSMTVTAQESAYVEHYLPDQDFSDFALTLEATPVDSEEHYAYGVSIRVDEDGNSYAFEIGNDGLYYIGLYDGEWQALIDWTSTEAIQAGQTNEIQIIADGSALSFVVNDELLASVEDDTIASGEIGLIVEVFEGDIAGTVDFDNLIIEAPDRVDLASTDTETEPVALPFETTPYEHPTGAFAFAVPEGWEVLDETETLVSGAFGEEDVIIVSEFADAGFVHTRDSFQEFIDLISANIIENFGDSYEVVLQEGDPNDKIYLSTTFTSNTGDGDIDFLFLQRKTVVYVLYFVTTSYDQMLPTWEQILESYTVDPDAALASLPTPTPAPRPTEPPAPAEPSAPAGKGVLLFRNNTGLDFVIDVIGPTNTSEVIPPNSAFEFVLDPGQYTINGHSPGGQYAINAYSFDLAVGQVFPLNLN